MPLRVWIRWTASALGASERQNTFPLSGSAHACSKFTPSSAWMAKSPACAATSASAVIPTMPSCTSMNLGIGTLLPWGTLALPERSVSPLAQRDGRGDRSGTPPWWGPRGPPPPVRCLDDAAVPRKRQEAIPATVARCASHPGDDDRSRHHGAERPVRSQGPLASLRAERYRTSAARQPSVAAPLGWRGDPPALARPCFCGGVERQRLGRLECQGGLAVSGPELAVARTDEAHPSVAVVARAVLCHEAFVDHGPNDPLGPKQGREPNGTTPGRPVRVPSFEESGAPGAETGGWWVWTAMAPVASPGT